MSRFGRHLASGGAATRDARCAVVVTRRCRGSRFCQFTAGLRPDRIVVVGEAPQAIVGACWFESFDNADEPARPVCNRCAHRGAHPQSAVAGWERVWVALCPFCGQPLGKPGAATVLLRGDGSLELGVVPELEVHDASMDLP